MCGRFVVARASAELIADYGVDLPGDDLPEPRWNIAPTTRIPVLIDTVPRASAAGDADASAPGESAPQAARRRLEGAHWGLVPRWAKDASVGVRAFNARSETAATKPTFRAAVAARRAVVPTSGYYEWHKLPDGTKQPHFLHLPEGDLLMAGLYEWWQDPADPQAPWLLSATILTRAATPELAVIHDRMPVFLDRERLDEWLDPGTKGDDGLVAAFAEHGGEVARRVVHRPVDRRVGNVRNEGPELIDPLDPAEAADDLAATDGA